MTIPNEKLFEITPDDNEHLPDLEVVRQNKIVHFYEKNRYGAYPVSGFYRIDKELDIETRLITEKNFTSDEFFILSDPLDIVFIETSDSAKSLHLINILRVQHPNIIFVFNPSATDDQNYHFIYEGADRAITYRDDPRVVFASMQALNKRVKDNITTQKADEEMAVDFVISNDCIYGPNQNPIDITYSENQLLAYLIANQNKLLSYEEIWKIARPNKEWSGEKINSVQVLISRLFYKVKLSGSKLEVRNDREFGYVFNYKNRS